MWESASGGSSGRAERATKRAEFLAAVVLALASAARLAAEEPRRTDPGFVVHFDCLRNAREARALVDLAARQGAAVVSIVPPAHVWENREALAMLDAILEEAARRRLRILFARIDAAYPPDARGRRDNYLYGRILTRRGRLPDGRPSAGYFLTTAGLAGYREWMEEETRYYAARFGRLPNLAGIVLGPFAEPFASERGSLLQFVGRTNRYEIAQYTPEALALWHRWLETRIGDIAAINGAYGTDFPSLEKVPLPLSEEDTRFGAPLAAYFDFVRSLNDWFVESYERCRKAWHEASGRDDVPFILQLNGLEAEKIAKGRPGLAAFDLPDWIARADAVGLSLYAHGGYADFGRGSIAAMVRLAFLARDMGKEVFVLEAGVEAPNVVVNARELAFLATAAAPLTPRTWIYEFFKDKFNEQYASNPGKLVRADGSLRPAAVGAVRRLFERVVAAPPDAEKAVLRVAVEASAARKDGRLALLANALFDLAGLVPIRWVVPATESRPGGGTLLRLDASLAAVDELTSRLLSVAPPGTDARQEWLRSLAAFFGRR